MTTTQKLRFGIAGMTSDHVWGMADGLAALPEVELVAAAEPYQELREQGTQRWGLRHTYADVEKMLDAEALDAILVCGDNAGKADIAEAAARRKVHVYQDKPMAATLAQADRILRAARQSGITLMVAYHSAFNPTYDQVKALLQAGAIGTPYLARGVTGHGGPLEFGCSKYFCEWLFDQRRNGGGAFVDEACYLVDGFVDYLGAIAEVSAFTTQMGHRDYLPPGVEDNSVAILRFASGALGVIDAKWGQVGPAPLRTSFHGTHGTLITGPAGTELFSTVAPSPHIPQDWEPAEVPAGRGGPGAPGLHAWRTPIGQSPAGSAGQSPAGSAGQDARSGRGGREQRYFVDCLLHNHPVEGASSPQVARDVQEVIEAVYRSAETARTIRLPLE